jgi:hypothetical protein
MDDKVATIWARMNESERYGARLGLFPAWIEEYSPTHEDHVALMGMGDEKRPT